MKAMPGTTCSIFSVSSAIYSVKVSVKCWTTELSKMLRTAEEMEMETSRKEDDVLINYALIK